MHPETRETIEAGIGRFGPYVRMGAIYGSLDRDDDVLAIGINRAVDLIARKMASVRTLGAHPADKELVAVRKGRFGPYVQHGKTVANLPRGVMMEEITLDRGGGAAGGEGQAAAPARRGRAARTRCSSGEARGRRTRPRAPARARPSPPPSGAARKPSAPRRRRRRSAGEEEEGGARQEAHGPERPRPQGESGCPDRDNPTYGNRATPCGNFRPCCRSAARTNRTAAKSSVSDRMSAPWITTRSSATAAPATRSSDAWNGFARRLFVWRGSRAADAQPTLGRHSRHGQPSAPCI